MFFSFHSPKIIIVSNQAKEFVKALCQTMFYVMMVRQERFLKTFLVLTVKASFFAPVRYLHENVTLCPFLV